MKKGSLVLLLIFSLLINSYAQDINYAVKPGIAPELLLHANSVKRIDDTKIDITDIGHATIHRKYVLPLLNAAGDADARFGHYYDKFWRIESVEGTLFDSEWKENTHNEKSSELMMYSDVPAGIT